MAEDHKNQPITMLLRPQNFGPHDLDYDNSGIPIISAARLQEIWEIYFNQAFIK
jgi:hypothetical protein